MWEFIGALFGMSIRSGILLNLNLADTVWKQLTDEKLTNADLMRIDKKLFDNFAEYRRYRDQ